jgi:hypothetical protein
VSQNTDELWKSLVKEKFPNSTAQDLIEARITASIAWCFGEKTVMSEIYDKFVMLKRWRGL